MMNVITALFCVLVKQVISQTKDPSPANILALQKTISENSDLYLTCSTFGLNKISIGFLYLCKNGVGFMMIVQNKDKTDITFQIPRVGLNDSGNYSCVYSTKNYTLSAVTKAGNNIVQIQVIANFLPANLSVVGQPAVYEGDHVEFRCTLSGTLHTLNECQLIESYLWKNKTVMQMQAFNVVRKEASFTIEGAVMRDSGHYSCTVLPTKCIQEHEKALHGRNEVFLEVKVPPAPLVIVCFGLMVLMLFLTLFLWWILSKRGQIVLHSLCMSQRAIADMLEQTAEEDVVAQDEEADSFSVDEEAQYWHDETADSCTHADDHEGFYSVIHDCDEEYDDVSQICQLTHHNPSARPSGEQVHQM